MAVAVVTDSTAYLPPERAGGITVVPLTVTLGGVEGVDGEDVTPARVAAALAEHRVSVTTSRPPPGQFIRTYRRLLDAGATGIVSVHLSAQLSGTYEAAVLAAAEVGEDRVVVVDSRSAGMGLGFCALAAAAAASEVASAAPSRAAYAAVPAAASDSGSAGVAAVAAAARSAVTDTSTFFYVDTLEFLRRGGRISAASALLGTALSVKPILHVADGTIVVRDRVRTATRALDRLVDLAVAAAGESEVDIAVHHLTAQKRAQDVGRALAQRLGPRLRDRWTTEVGAVVAAHVGPGLVGVVVHRVRPAGRSTTSEA